MISALNRLANGTIELTITIPTKRVKDAYEKKLSDLAKKVEIKGFRIGKAPGKLVEKKVGQKAIDEELLKSLIPEVYVEAVKEHQLKPILNPQVQLIATQEGKDWQIKTITCELPKVNLGQYEEEVGKTSAADKIWVPGKDKKENPPPGGQGDKKLTEEEKISQIFKRLLEVCQVEVPDLLIQDEINRMLSRLIDQTARLGLTVEQYLTSSGKTIETIKEEYRKQAIDSLKLELILSAIADDKKIQISDDQVDKMIAAAPDQETQKKLNSPDQRIYLKQLLRKREMIDRLSHL